jgi:hypothetical protein
MKEIIEKLFASAPQPEGESARIRALIDADPSLPWMEAQVTIQGGLTFGGLLTTGDGCLRMITPQSAKGGAGVVLIEQYFAWDAVIAIAKLINPPQVATRGSGIIVG